MKEEKYKFIPVGISIYKRLYRSKEFIDDCFSEPLKLETIARQAYLSPYHFLRIFKKIYNKTPHQYLTERRIEKARELLKKNDSSVTGICFEVGFNSLSSFSALFTRYTGISPSGFREQCMRKAYLSVRFPEKQVPGCYLFYFNRGCFS